jgi:FAD/FMN-containing dehydrogenase
MIEADLKHVEGGSGLCPGYLGLALGGGVGRYMGLFGLVHDAWVSARVVVASGEIVTVSDDENQDLWWAMRGAGANFGVVTSATFQARKKSEYSDGFVLNADLYFPPEKTAEYFNYLASLDGQLPRNVAILHISTYNATTGQVSQKKPLCSRRWTN